MQFLPIINFEKKSGVREDLSGFRGNDVNGFLAIHVFRIYNEQKPQETHRFSSNEGEFWLFFK